MNALLPWLHIALGVLVYVIFALLASVVAQKAGQNMKEMEGRTAPSMIAIGMVGNLSILVVILLLVKFYDPHSISALGFSFGLRSLTFTLVALFFISVLALFFVLWLRRSGRVEVEVHGPARNAAELGDLILGWLLLFVVAAQEEVLFRGYITLNLLQYGPWIILLITTGIFAGIHVLTNRVSFYQLLSWLIGGAILGYAYLVTGSIWVPIFLHFATDLINVLVFNIVGQSSLFTITPSLTAGHRAGYRVAYALALAATLLAFYGPTLAISGM